eukprot:6471871-Ditylum_brightwellii.AAC.1
MNKNTVVGDWVAQDSIYTGCGNSEVVLKELDGLCAVWSISIIYYYNEAIDLLENSGVCEWHTCKHVTRSDNSRADTSANDAIDND